MTKFQKKLWVGLLIMVFLSPFGVYLPKLFNANEAWGEWGTDAIERMMGYVSEGMKKLADRRKAPIADYNFGGEGAALSTQMYSYVISALIGITVVAALIYAISKLLVRFTTTDRAASIATVLGADCYTINELKTDILTDIVQTNTAQSPSGG